MAAAVSAGSGGLIDLGLQGSTVVVTGAGSGIGAATARLLGAAGASVVLVGRRAAPLRKSADAIEHEGSHALARLISRYALPTVTLHDALPAFRGDEVADVGPMYPCGPGRHGFLNRPQADMQLRTSARS
jgi:NAD(P)-dependent dehydrogenase (short-subunit alcohol dehydrogenase family)